MSKLVGTIDCNSIMAYKIIQEVENTHQIPQTLNFETRTQSLEKQAQEKMQKQANMIYMLWVPTILQKAEFG